MERYIRLSDGDIIDCDNLAGAEIQAYIRRVHGDAKRAKLGITYHDGNTVQIIRKEIK